MTDLITTPFSASPPPPRSSPASTSPASARIVTGGASGIGVETARALAGAGAEVTLAVRDLDAGARTAEDITATTGNEHVLVAPLDLADRRRSPRSSPPGTARCTSWSTTPA